jgi:hypothetical protein
MCFRTESLQTGEDVLVALRRILKSAVSTAAALLLAGLALGPLRAAPQPDAASPEQLRGAIQQAVQAHEYDWRFPAKAPRTQEPSWLMKASETVFHWLSQAIRWMGNAIGKLIDWLLDRLRGITPQPGGAAAPEGALHWSIYLLLALLLGLVGVLIWRLRRLRRAKTKAAPATAAVVRLEDESVTPDRLPEEEWLAMAETCLRDGDFRLALRAFYLANLAWLGHEHWIAIHPGKTNREYMRELRKRARGASEAQQLFGENLAAFERAWYGMRPVSEPDAAAFRARNQSMKALLAPLRTIGEEAA